MGILLCDITNYHISCFTLFNYTPSPKCYEVVTLIFPILQMKKQATRNEVTSQGQIGARVEHPDQRLMGDH